MCPGSGTCSGFVPEPRSETKPDPKRAPSASQRPTQPSSTWFGGWNLCRIWVGVVWLRAHLGSICSWLQVNSKRFGVGVGSKRCRDGVAFGSKSGRFGVVALWGNPWPKAGRSGGVAGGSLGPRSDRFGVEHGPIRVRFGGDPMPTSSSCGVGFGTIWIGPSRVSSAVEFGPISGRTRVEFASIRDRA